MNRDFFYRNLKALETKHPKTAERILSSRGDGSYGLIPSVTDGSSNLVYSNASPPILLHDPHDPGREITRFLEAILQGSRNRFLVLLGIGMGYVAEEILQSNTDLAKMIIVEKDPACLKTAMGVRDLTRIFEDRRIRIVAGDEEHDLYVSLYEALKPDFPRLKELKFVPWPASIAISETYYRKVVTTFREIADTYGADRGNDPYDTLVAYEQFFANITDLMKRPGGGYVKDFFKGRPAVVVATGPSLKKNIHLLKEIENSALIISADASLRVLHNHNIYPHMVATVERPPGYAVYYEGLDHLEKTVFAAASFLHPSTLKAYRGPIIFFHRIYNFLLQLGFREDAFYMGITTAHMGYEVARHMGCNPIVLIGNDLAYDSGGNTHAPGFILGEKHPYYDDFDKIDVPGNVQPLVKTCDGWFAGIKQYEKRIENWPGTLINATEGGARIRGSVVSTLRDVIDRHCQVPFHPREAMRDHLAEWRSDGRPEDMLEKVNRFIEVTDHFIETCKKIRPLLGKTLSEVESVEALTPEIRRHLDQSIHPVETVLNNISDTELAQYFGEYLYTDIFPLLMEWQVIESRFTDPDWAKAYRIKLAENFIGGLGQLCVSLKEVLLDGRSRLMKTTPSAH